MNEEIAHIFKSVSQDGDVLNQVFFYFLIIAVIISLIIGIAVFYIIRKFKSKELQNCKNP